MKMDSFTSCQEVWFMLRSCFSIFSRIEFVVSPCVLRVIILDRNMREQTHTLVTLFTPFVATLPVDSSIQSKSNTEDYLRDAFEIIQLSAPHRDS